MKHILEAIAGLRLCRSDSKSPSELSFLCLSVCKVKVEALPSSQVLPHMRGSHTHMAVAPAQTTSLIHCSLSYDPANTARCFGSKRIYFCVLFFFFFFQTLTHYTSLPLQVCVVSLVGFVMLCISYQPDEKTCVQFTVKVP